MSHSRQSVLAMAHAGTVSLHPQPLLPEPAIENVAFALVIPGHLGTAELAAYQDKLLAYLMFNRVRHSPRPGTTRLVLTFDKRKGRPYSLLLCGPPDLLRAIPEVTSIVSAAPEPRSTWALTPLTRIAGVEQRTRLSYPHTTAVQRKLEELPRASLSKQLQRFIQFKSRTDRRIRLKLEPVPKPLSGDEAGHLARDILEVGGVLLNSD